MVRTDSRLFSRGRRYLGYSQRKRLPFRLRGCHPLWPAFPDLSAASTVCQILSRRAAGTRYPTTPRTQRPPTWHVLRFRLFRVRSPLLTESMARSVPVVTEMFHFATCGSPACAGGTGVSSRRVSPFGNPGIATCSAVPPGISQLAASFFASGSQGIPHAPLVAYPHSSKSRGLAALGMMQIQKPSYKRWFANLP